ncbi:nucleoside triphosphate pyrophosphohydrolase family protein [Methylomonas sp. UP202]|uniref:nucleoside triphosphate pyrophosphohydrolase family protein n=1 Tax=Methylomonas sp. UP202 TaxID=3040943 RepID=UPI002478F922|nr:nucleoside triphosphate pyrophosphohydrolase family protein [Methylomonas sp. UP202]WGS87549.1 nucleoside triphosphate pyrophosphohydrolase family protein [Methylomonas sp. UP202]
MNKHLQLVKEFHRQFGIAQPDDGDLSHLSDMDIVMRQALLLDCASHTFKAVAGGDLLKILAGLVDLAFNALAAIACRGDEVVTVSVNWRQDGSVLSLVRALSDKVQQCVSGETVHYSALYALCGHLAQRFVNADFDQAFQLVHGHLMAGLDDSQPVDLSPALFE